MDKLKLKPRQRYIINTSNSRSGKISESTLRLIFSDVYKKWFNSNFFIGKRKYNSRYYKGIPDRVKKGNKHR